METLAGEGHPNAGDGREVLATSGIEVAPRSFFGEGGHGVVARPPPATPVPEPMRAPLPTIGAIVGVALIVGVAVGFTWGRLLSPVQREALPVTPSVPRRESGPVPSPQSRQAAQQLSGWKAEPQDPLDLAATAIDGVVAPLRLSPPYDALDSAVFDSSDQRIRLARILPVGRTEVCTDGGGRRFACGLMSRAALQNLVARRVVVCDRLFLARDDRQAVVDADCSVEGIDLAEHLVRSGWAFPSPLAGEHHRTAQAEAQARGVGVWAGAYAVPERDRAEDDIRAISFGSLRLPPVDPAAASRSEPSDRTGDAAIRPKP